MKETDRRSFLKIAGASIGVGALFHFAPSLGASPAGAELARMIKRKTGEAPRPFSFVQLSDTHVGFNGPPSPLGTRAFEEAVRIDPAFSEAWQQLAMLYEKKGNSNDVTLTKWFLEGMER